MIHVRYDGHSYDFRYDELDVGDLSTDAELRESVVAPLAEQSGMTEGTIRNKLRGFAVDRGTEGEVTLRPQAVFGD